MDRLSRVVMHGGLALLLGSTISISVGCRSMKSEIPPAKTAATTGAPTPEVGFSAAPRPDATGAGGLYNNGVQQTSGDVGIGMPGGVQQASGNALPSDSPSGQPQFGTPIGNKNSYNDALPAGGRYGPPGTNSLPSPSDSQAMPTPAANTTPAQPKSDNPMQGAIGVDLP